MEVLLDSEKKPYLLLGEHRIRFECEPFQEGMYKEKAAAELRESEEVVQQAVKELRALLTRETDLNVPLDDDKFLIKFLRPCKFYADSTFERIKSYYKFRLNHPQYCRDLVPSQIRKPFESGVISILSPRDNQGRRLMVVEAGEAWDYHDVPLKELFRGIQLGLEAAMAEPRTQVSGVVVLFDMKGLYFSQVLQFTPMFAKMLVDFIQDCIPIRLKAVHVINQPYIFNMLFAIFKPFLSEKLRSRIYFHGNNRQSLLSHVNAEAICRRHGGTMPGPEIPGGVLWQMLMHYEDKFKETNMYGYPDKSAK